MKKILLALVLVSAFAVNTFAAINWTPRINVKQVEIVQTQDSKEFCMLYCSDGRVYGFFMANVGAANIYNLALQALNNNKTVNLWAELQSSSNPSYLYLFSGVHTNYYICAGISYNY